MYIFSSSREEFSKVYEWLFGDTANWETKQKACDLMTIWKLRRLNLTPASVLSTLAILEVQLRDDEKIQPNKNAINELRTMYSNAFTR